MAISQNVGFLMTSNKRFGGPKVRVVVFDVCGTLYDSNTTIDFVIYFLNSLGLRRKALAFSVARLKVVSFLAYRLFGFNLRTESIKALRSWSRDLIDSVAVEFVFCELGIKRNDRIFSVLYGFFEDEDTEIYLASASIEPVVGAIGRSLGIKWVSSTLAFDSFGKCTGQLAEDITGKKMEFLLKRYGLSFVDSFYSDNVEDIPASSRTNSFVFVKSGMLSSLRARRMRSSYPFSTIERG